MKKPVPVILDTDIGSDIDDSWALAMMLNSPELDVKLITTATLNTPHRTAIAAKLLEAAGRTDIPIGTGPQFSDLPIQVSPWIKDFDLRKYKGKIYSDGVDAMVRTVMDSKEKVTIISIGPLTNVAAALIREPRLAEKAVFKGMHGSINRQHRDQPGAIAEYNVIVDVQAAMKVFETGWDMTITPLDTCGNIVLDGEHYRRVAESRSPLTKAVIDSYHVWLGGNSDNGRSSILYDTVAIYLAFAEDLLDIRKLPIRIGCDGMMLVDEANGKKVRCALEWKSKDAFKDLLVERLVK